MVKRSAKVVESFLDSSAPVGRLRLVGGRVRRAWHGSREVVDAVVVSTSVSIRCAPRSIAGGTGYGKPPKGGEAPWSAQGREDAVIRDGNLVDRETRIPSITSHHSARANQETVVSGSTNALPLKCYRRRFDTNRPRA